MSNPKYKKLVGKDARSAENMEREINRVARFACTPLCDISADYVPGVGTKNANLAEAEGELAAANKTPQTAETTISQAKSQLKTKREELKRTFLLSTLRVFLVDATSPMETSREY